ncbi:MAG TPA: TlyA family RNA methyltransferase [Dermatophilaceae bacterium]|nr:TlyA family RNA methyltransferase [Dermatophilaceae bacterium]
MGRLDAELVRRGLARSRGEARDLIAGGRVRVAGRPGVVKPATDVPAAAELIVERDGPVWVSRAAGKLRHALALWGSASGPDGAAAGPPGSPGIPVRGRWCLDVGASTGGFTQVLLEAGAAGVTALDVGHGQLAPLLADDPRVVERSGTSVRDVTAADLDGPFDLVVADLSFISLSLVLEPLRRLVRDDGHVVALVKPQFEVGRAALARAGRRGVVSDPQARRTALLDVLAAAESAGLHAFGLARSPVVGTEGNVEYLLWARPDGSGRMGGSALHGAVATLTTGGAT